MDIRRCSYMHLKQPFFRYGLSSYFYPGVTMEDITETKSVERYDHISGSGKKASFLVGSRNFKDFAFHWLSDSDKTLMETFWDSIKDGSSFWIVFDDSVRLFGDGSLFGDGYLFGDDSDGDAITSTEYTTENMELTFTPEEVYGYWSVSMRVREVV